MLVALTVAGGCAPEGEQDFDGDGVADVADCDPNDSRVYPAAWDPVDAEGLDANCDGVDGVDADGDGFASAASGGADCHDGDPAVNPGVVEGVAQADDGIDNDCSGGDLQCDLDEDDAPGDQCGGPDCDDGNSVVRPGAPELCDGADTDCDGAVPDDELDEDGDGVRG